MRSDSIHRRPDESDQGTEFLMQLAHDMRNSLGTIRSAARLIAATESEAQYAAEARLALEQQIERMAALIDTLKTAPPLTTSPRKKTADGNGPVIAAQGLSHEPPAQARRAQRNILIADDNDDAATTLALILRLEGHAVTVAHDGEEAITLAEASRPDVVLLGICMPRMDGFEVAKELQSRAWSGACRLIAVCGWASQEDHDRALASGFSAHLAKPIDIDRSNHFLQTSAS